MPYRAPLEFPCTLCHVNILISLLIVHHWEYTLVKKHSVTIDWNAESKVRNDNIKIDSLLNSVMIRPNANSYHEKAVVESTEQPRLGYEYLMDRSLTNYAQHLETMNCFHFHLLCKFFGVLLHHWTSPYQNNHSHTAFILV